MPGAKLNGFEKIIIAAKNICRSLALALALAWPAAGVAQFTYITNAGSITITGYSGAGGALTIPAAINGLPVTSLGVNAFSGNTTFDSVSIPESVTSIGVGTFAGCGDLHSITIPAGVTNLGSYAFSGCRALTGVYFESLPPSADQSVFLDDNYATVYCLAGTAGWSSPFYSRPVMPMTLQSGDFLYTPTAGAITVHGYTADGNAITINAGSAAISGYAGTGGGLNIPPTLDSVPVTSIQPRAFYGLYVLSDAVIPAGVTNVGAGAFAGCGSITAITVDPQNAVYCSVDGVVYDKSQTTLVAYPEGLPGARIPATVTTIGPWALAYFGWDTFTIPDTITNIAAEAFIYNEMSSITIPNSVLGIGDQAFAHSGSATNLVIGDGVRSIGELAFFNCSVVPSITLPRSVTSLGNSALEFCANMVSVTIDGGVTNLGTNLLEYNSKLTTVFFRGDAPTFGPGVFMYSTHATVYYLPGTTGWFSPFAGRPAVLWDPLIQADGSGFGVRGNQFGFDLAGTPNLPVVVEGSSSPAGPVWSVLKTATLTNGLIHFSETVTNTNASRFYRLVP